MTQSALYPTDFQEFFERVHGRPPFRWQSRAAKELAEGKLWPTLEAPTGSGKTSLIDCLIFALACQADQSQRTVPLRTFWVVDRRAVVDQVYAHAQELEEAVADGDGIVGVVRHRLEQLDGLGGLFVQRWRGGLSERRDQLRLTGPVVVCSTIDQVGSRLLFRGYGTSRRSRPIDAALVGTDSLIVLDEAHLAEPFVDTLQRVRELATADDSEVSVPSAQSLVLSATLPTDASQGFRLIADERRDALIAQRLQARKELRLVRTRRRREGLVGEARGLAGVIRGLDGAPPVIGVVANTVAEARAAHRSLGDAGEEAILVIGPCRPYERDKLLAEIPARAERGERVRPLFVVATQTIEVGVDLDFDALVTAAAPLGALVQRLGRLDRRGKRYAGGDSASPALIVSSREPCFVYGDVAGETWRWLDEQSDNGSLTVDAEVLGQLRSKNPPVVNGPLAPILGRWHVDALVQTSVDPVPSPAIGPFLHGEQALEQADVRVIWRADLDPDDDRNWAELAVLVPPQAHEAISLPIGRIREWLSDSPRGTDDALAFGDVESLGEGETAGDARGARAMRWDPRQPEIIDPSGIRPGDTLLLPAEYGGVDRFGWNPSEGRPARDVGDLGPDSRRLRLHPALGIPEALVQAISDIEGRVDAGEIEAREAYSDALASLRNVPEESDPEGGLTAAIAGLPSHGELVPHPSGDGYILIGKSLGAAGTRPRRISYSDHVDAVTRHVDSTAQALGIIEPVRKALVLAAQLHDAGKLDSRFQAWMNGGVPADENILLAKSGRTPNTPADRRARRDARWPEGMPHELWSAALADAVVRRDGWRESDLVGYLIAVHHGRHRPFYGKQLDLNPIWVEANWEGRPVELRSDARVPWSEHVRRFAALNRRFGPWGLAALEAMLVLSDRAVSAQEQNS